MMAERELGFRKMLEKSIVENIKIVLPENVDVLRQDEEDVITLVTCYPFYYVGSAPKRYIVRAVRAPRG